MNFWEELRKHCLENTDRETLPESVCISCERRHDFSEFRLSGTWTVQKPRSEVFGTIIDGESEDKEIIDWPEHERLTIDDGELFESVNEVFFEYLDKVQLQDAKLQGVTFFGPNHATGFIDGASVRMFVESTSKVDKNVDRVCSEILDEVREVDKTAEFEDIAKVSSLLSDRDVCQADTVDAKVLTKRPADYFSDVEHVKEAADVVADNEDEEKEIVNADGYVGMFIGKRSMDDYEISDELTDIVEEDVRSVFRSTVHTDLETVLEGEAWSANIREVPSDYYSFASGVADCEDVGVGKKSVMFWVHSPVDALGSL